MPAKTVYKGYSAAKQQFLVGTADVFQASVYYANRMAMPSSAALTVYRPSSGAKLIDGAAMSIDAQGVMSYQLTAQDNAVAEANYKAIVNYVYNSAQCSITLFYDVVRSRLTSVITDEDIMAELPQLKDAGWQVRGTAEGGSTTTIIDAELKRYEDGYFTGGLARSLDKNQTREITGFASATGIVTTSPFTSAIAADRYVLTRSYAREIRRAFEKIEERIVRNGKRPELVLDPYDLRGVHICYAVAEACKGLAGDSKGFWWEMWKEYEKKGEEAFKGIDFKYDSSNDGFIAAGENAARMSATTAARR